ncbi:MAG TPA: 50S ribosomal protein L17 [Ignavibacteria bacterium]|nr:50S ribosomal protein L17 [Bacteroidota bacterium]HRE12108.1 50S ribosomal protein L17 [Ignavibacteria bacterium]HRF66590.1 50S ribosomal protein L17 [Ignavibacteria bacterium]HRJ03681.1 50S ribosomal protein L17 [Ignavibacteria bacterium]HRJ84788.1 50S ribosomal protein L17 [Ignavibacteria bacterium]
MIHRRKGRKLKRTYTHRKALLANLCVALIKNKKIKTTLAKAKELRLYIEPIITKSRKALNAANAESGVHLRREVNKFLQDKGAITTLFNEIAPKMANRNGGYTRVLKMGRRLGDGAEVAMIELVDYNVEQAPEKPETTETETKGKTKTASKTKTAAKPKAKTTAKTKKAAGDTEVKKTTKGRKKKEAAE